MADGSSSVLVIVRGRLVASPTIRIIDKRRRSASFDLACSNADRRVIVPVVVVDIDVPALKVGDDVTVLGHIHRRFWRATGRTQAVTEVVADEIVASRRSARIDALYVEAQRRVRAVRTCDIPDRQ